ncbi:MAG: response regulator [Elusimicrobia bacterium]|nr:response regulator [Elusimicrobiota bacterium]
MNEETRQERILVVDDEPGIAELISDFCSELGYAVCTVTESNKAIAAAKEFKPDLITLDLQMPNVDGFELLKRLKEDPDTSTIPVIIVSILAGEADRQGMLSAAQAILTKPINFRKLRDKVGQYVKEKSAADNPNP